MALERFIYKNLIIVQIFFLLFLAKLVQWNTCFWPTRACTIVCLNDIRNLFCSGADMDTSNNQILYQ